MNIFSKKSEESRGIDWFKAIPITIGVFYIMGFLVWNIYLALFGFFEYNFLQTRFLSAGIVASLVIFPIIVLLYLIIDFLLRWLYRFFKGIKFLVELKNSIQLFLVSSFFVICLLAYSYWIFPIIPQFLGGARPVIASILGTPDQIAYLKNFNILSAPNAGKMSVQTVPICVLYQNNDYVLIGVQYATGIEGSKSKYIRDLLLKSEQTLGFQYGLGEDVRCRASDFFVGLRPLKGEMIYDMNLQEPIMCK